MIRVLHSVSNMDRAGIETMLMNYYRNIDRDKIQFDFLCNKKIIGAYDEEIKRLGGNVYYSPGFNPLKIIFYIKFLKKIKNNNPDIKIIHAHNGALSAYSLFCAKKAGFNIRIAHSHSTKIPSSKRIKALDIKWIYKSMLKKMVSRESTYNIACGNEAGSFLFNKKKFVILNNAIIVERFMFNNEKRKAIRKKYNIVQNEVLLGHVGRFNIVKNHEFIIKLISELNKNSKKKYKLLLIGDGELKNRIQILTKKLNLEDKVIFIDNVSNVCDYYNAMDLFLLPSKFEGIPVVGIEAQVNGLKCLFSNKISNEADISRTVSFFEIDNVNSIQLWAKSINKINNYTHLNKNDEIYKFDARYNANLLADIYINMSRD